MHRITFLSFLFILFAACNLNPSVNADKHLNESYGPDTRNKLDIYLPNHRDSSTATVMLIHGGGWVAGSKADWAADLINNIVNQGYAVACMNYRYANGNIHNQMNDIHMALSHINDKAGAWNIGANKYGLMGASAGGHLSLLYSQAYDSTQSVKAVVSLVGPTDLTDTIFHQYAANYNISYVFPQLLGADFQTNPQVYADASPVFYHKNVPTLFIHGSLDNLVPPAQGVRMFDSLGVHGIATDTTFFGNAGHDVLGPNQVNKQQVYNEVNHWLLNYLH